MAELNMDELPATIDLTCEPREAVEEIFDRIEDARLRPREDMALCQVLQERMGRVSIVERSVLRRTNFLTHNSDDSAAYQPNY